MAKLDPSSSQLLLKLSYPGMSFLHRTGLGGLASTLRRLEQDEANLSSEELPGGRWSGAPPWKIEPTQVLLDFGEPGAAREYLRRLFAYAFQILPGSGLIYLPGQHERAPEEVLLADLQQGLLLTFLQHGKVRKLRDTSQTLSYQPEGEDGPQILVEFRECESYRHQEGWKELTQTNGGLATKGVAVIGPVNPGAIVRHVAFSTDTQIEDVVERILPLYFAMVGCLALPVNRGIGVLIAPEVTDLIQFARKRPNLTPQNFKETRVANAADGILQALIRLEGTRLKSVSPACYAVTFRPTSWASQQKSRTDTLMVDHLKENNLRRFAIALAYLPTEIGRKTEKSSSGRGRQKIETTETTAFRKQSLVRPLAAYNLARGRPWYEGFQTFFTSVDHDGKPKHEKLRYERKGLDCMIEDPEMLEGRETAFIRAVHKALQCRYAQIAEENKKNSVAMKSRWAREYERRRLSFSGAKTEDQFREALCDLLSRAGANSELQQSWSKILPFMNSSEWRLGRDLALLGLCSYSSGKEENDDILQENEEA